MIFYLLFFSIMFPLASVCALKKLEVNDEIHGNEATPHEPTNYHGINNLRLRTNKKNHSPASNPLTDANNIRENNKIHKPTHSTQTQIVRPMERPGKYNSRPSEGIYKWLINKNELQKNYEHCTEPIEFRQNLEQ